MVPLTALYKALLESLNVVSDEHGLLSSVVDGKNFPCSCSDKRLVLPTKVLLDANNWAKLVAFHPLSENTLRGESPVVKKLRTLIVVRLTTVISHLMANLMDIAANIDGHKKLSPKQMAFLKLVPDADATTVANLNKLLAVVSPTKTNRLISIYLKRGAQVNGRSFQRVAVVSFPIFEEFEAKEEIRQSENGKPRKVYSIWGVEMRKKDREAIVALFQYLIPGADNPQMYSGGSNETQAPYFCSLVHAYANVATMLNEHTKLFVQHLDEPEFLTIDLKWQEGLFDASGDKVRAGLIDQLPTPLDGNEGSLTKDDEQPPPPQPRKPQLGWQHDALGTSTIPENDPPFVPDPPRVAATPVKQEPVAIVPSCQVTSKVTPISQTARVIDDGSEWEAMVAKQTMGNSNGVFGHLMPGGQPQQVQTNYTPGPMQQLGAANFGHLFGNGNAPSPYHPSANIGYIPAQYQQPAYQPPAQIPTIHGNVGRGFSNGI